MLLRLMALMLLMWPTAAWAEEGLSIESELQRPGVRLLAVEFFSNTCEPCKKAAPRWKALHDKFRSRGLRFVVVSVDDDGRWQPAGWRSSPRT